MAAVADVDVKRWNARMVAHLKGLEDKALKRDPDSRLRWVYNRAAKALGQATFRVTCKADALKLKGIGPNIAGQLDMFLQQQEGGGGGGGGRSASQQAMDELDEVMQDMGMRSQSQTYMMEEDEASPPPKARGGKKAAATTSAQRGGGGGGSAASASAKSTTNDGGSKPQEKENQQHPSVAVAGGDGGGKAGFEVIELSDDHDDENEEEEEEEQQDEEDQLLNYNPTGLAMMRAASQQKKKDDDYDENVVDLLSESEDEAFALGGGGGGGGSGNSTPPIPAMGSVMSSGSTSRKRKLIPPAFPPPGPKLLPGVQAPPIPLLLRGAGGGAGGNAASREREEAITAFLTAFEQERKDKDEEEAEAVARPATLDHLLEHFRGTRPEEWELMLVLDQQEHNKNPRVQSLLLQNNVKCEVKRLTIGDMQWVVKRRSRYAQQLQQQQQAALAGLAAPGGLMTALAVPPPRADDGNAEWFMLRYVMERKTGDDLLASIVDGRYKEQKGRMLGVGKELDKAFYLVEGNLANVMNKNRIGAACTAINNTHVLHGMPVLRTESLEGTIDLLRKMHRQLEHSFAYFVRVASAGKEAWATYLSTHLPELPLPPTNRLIRFEEYQQMCKKRGAERTVRELFTIQLCAIQGISEQKAKAVMAAYPTPKLLSDAMVRMSEAEAVRALEKLPVPGQTRTLGEKNARLLYKVYA